MRTTIAEVMDGHGTIEDEELTMIKEAADLQKGLEE